MTGGDREVTLSYIVSDNDVVNPINGAAIVSLFLLMVPSRSTHKVFLILNGIKLLGPIGEILLRTITVADMCTLPLVYDLG